MSENKILFETKAVPMYAKMAGDRTVVGLAAVMGNIDEGLDRIWKGAFSKTIKENGRRIKHLWQHEYWNPPIAVIKSLQEISKRELPQEVRERWPEATGGLEVEREYLSSARGDEVLTGISKEAILEMSIGYNPIKADMEVLEEYNGAKGVQIRNLREARLYDTSDVNWGMNAATVAAKAAVPYADHGTAEEGTSWSKPTLNDFTSDSWGDLSDGEKRRIAEHYAWAANMPPQTFGDLKLPHHQAGSSGVGKAVWKGVSSAMGALLGARGGVQIPSEDRKSVYNHLAKHYAQFDKEPPDFKFIELAAVLAALSAEDWKPGALSKQHLDRLHDALGMVQEILLAAEPPLDEKSQRALTRRIERELEIREREIELLTR
jgi:HK97 family phage prohead protease